MPFYQLKKIGKEGNSFEEKIKSQKSQRTSSLSSGFSCTSDLICLSLSFLLWKVQVALGLMLLEFKFQFKTCLTYFNFSLPQLPHLQNEVNMCKGPELHLLIKLATIITPSLFVYDSDSHST